jgi:hypothetical protein
MSHTMDCALGKKFPDPSCPVVRVLFVFSLQPF